MEVKTGYANINGARLYYEEAGSGFPVVFVHAGIADRRMWDDQFSRAAQEYRAIRFDMRGYGQSAMVPGPYSLRDDLYRLLQHLGVEQAALVGCSRGGQTVIDFTLEHPEMTAALVPVAAGLSGFIPEGEPPAFFAELDEADEAGDLDRLNELEIHLWVDGLSREPDAVDPAIRRKVLEMNRIALNTPADMGQPIPLEPPASHRMEEIHAPTLVIYGDLDLPNVGKMAQAMGSGIPNARVVCMVGTAHLPNMERPDEFNRILFSFLDAVLP